MATTTTISFNVTFDLKDYDLGDRSTIRTTLRNILHRQSKEAGWPSRGNIERITVEDSVPKP